MVNKYVIKFIHLIVTHVFVTSIIDISHDSYVLTELFTLNFSTFLVTHIFVKTIADISHDKLSCHENC